MKQKCYGKYIGLVRLVMLLLFLSLVSTPFLSAQEPSAQDIVKQWMEIKNRALPGTALSESQLLSDVDILCASIGAFQESQMYWMYRYVPVFNSSLPREVTEVKQANVLVHAYREALASGDRERAFLLSAEINTVMLNWLIWDAEMERFSGNGFFRLLLALILFLGITAIVVRLLHKSLNLSLKKEEESSFFTQALFFAQEQERGRISRELHDTVAQDLRGLSLGMEKISLTEDKGIREKLCLQAAAAHSDIIRRVRDICDYLVPPDFRFQGLPDALRRLCLEFGKRSGTQCRISIAENFDYTNLDEDKQLQVFRIVQEALTNVEKHANAEEVIVTIRSDSRGSIFVGISDNGRGFDYPFRKEIVSMGIRSMTKRASILGGSLTIRSEKGEGTMVALELPQGIEPFSNLG